MDRGLRKFCGVVTVGLGLVVATPGAVSRQRTAEQQPHMAAPADAGEAASGELTPVAEYAPTKALLLSAELFSANYHAAELISAVAAAGAEPWIVANAPQSSAELNKALGSAGVAAKVRAKARSIFATHGNIWLRDFGPLTAYDDNGKVKLFEFIGTDATATDTRRFTAELAAQLHLPITTVAYALDGGNFLVGGDFCFTSAADLPKTSEVIPRPPFARLGCRQTVVLTDPPHAHLDMWAKIVNDHQVFINELDARTLAVATRIYGHLPPELAALRDALDRQAKVLGRYLQVTRVPMPLPYRGSFRTYTNSILVNGHAIVPAYRRFGWDYDDYPDQALNSYYDETVRAAYHRAGFHVHQINADGLIYNGGAFHCVTAPMPFTRPPRQALKASKNQERKGH